MKALRARMITFLLLVLLAAGLLPTRPPVLAEDIPPQPPQPTGPNCGSTTLLANTIPDQTGPITVLASTGSFSWDSDADFLTGSFANTEVVDGAGSVTLARTGWTDNTRVNSASTSAQNNPDIAIDAAGTVYQIWTARDPVGSTDIFVLPLGNADTFPQPGLPGESQVSDGGPAARLSPSLAAGARGQLYAVWADNREGNFDIRTARSTDSGASWSASVRINDDTVTAIPIAQTVPQISVSATGILHAVWQDARNGNSDIYAARSTDGGQTWSTNLRINDDTGNTEQTAPALALDAQGNPYAIWVDGRNGGSDIYTTRSTDGGQTWDANVLVNDTRDTVLNEIPDLVVDGTGTLYAAWEAEGAILFDRSADGGQTWGTDVRVDDNTGSAATPRLAVSPRDGAVFCVWCSLQAGGANIRAASSQDGGQDWSASIQVNDVAGSATTSPPEIAADAAGFFYLTWGDDREAGSVEDIYTARWPDPTDVIHSTSGTYTTTYDVQDMVRWQTLAWQPDQPADTTLTLEVRVGNTATPDASWSAWTPLASSPASLDSLPASRYIQWRASLATSDTMITPALNTVVLSWNAGKLYLPIIVR